MFINEGECPTINKNGLSKNMETDFYVFHPRVSGQNERNLPALK